MVAYNVDPAIKSLKHANRRALIVSEKSVAAHVVDARDSHGVALVLTMTLTSTDNSTSIFEDGRLKPGTYKVQNIYARTYLDVVEHSRRMCCRPAQDLEEGGGIVRRYHVPVVRV
jgi:hypothetical protein